MNMEFEKRETISVVVPVKNGERFLSQALESIIAQTYSPIEIVVVDDHSNDTTVRIVRSYKKIKLVQNAGTGVSAALNSGIKNSSGEFIAFLAHDDLWLPDKLETQIQYLQKNPECDYVTSHVSYFLEQGSSVPKHFRKGLLHGSQPGELPETLLVRKNLFGKVGTFDESLSIASDVDWFARTKDSGAKTFMFSHAFVRKRIHGSNISLNVEQNNAELLALLGWSVKRKKSNADSISVVVPAYNAEKYLKEALESVFGQVRPPYEIIIVDDGSIDGTEAVAKSYGGRIHFLKCVHRGPGAARNVGARASSGKYLAFLDADDIWMPDKIEIELDEFKKNPSLEMVFGNVMQFVSPELDAAAKEKMRCSDQPVAGLIPSAMIVTRNAFMKVGFFSEKNGMADFADWYFRARSLAVKEKIIRNIVAKRRLHKTEVSLDCCSPSNYLTAIKTFLDRTRVKKSR